MDPQVEEEIRALASRLVAEGFEPREMILQEATEMAEYEYAVTDAADRIAEVVDAYLARHREEQETWSYPTDCDRLDGAFADLERQGIVARQHFACCQNCGNAEIGEEIEAFRKTAEPIGYTFYHMQDTERARECGHLFMTYGPVGRDDDRILQVARIICDTLGRHGLTVEWNGSAEQRIGVIGLDWKKCRSD